MWDWLKAILDWLTSKNGLFNWIRTEITRTRTIEDAKTPDTIRDAWDRDLRERLRDKDGGH